MTVAPQAETEIVTGPIIGIIQKGPDKWQVAVQPEGSQYSRNLWTKDAEMVSQLSQRIGQVGSFMCGISHWTNQSGQAVRSLWINGVGPAAAAAQAQAPVAAPQPVAAQQDWSAAQPTDQQRMQQAVATHFPQAQPQPIGGLDVSRAVTQDEREGRIMRQTATKVAAILLGYLPAEERTYDTVLVLSQRLMRYYEEGFAAVLPEQAQDGGEPPTDDIPWT